MRLTTRQLLGLATLLVVVLAVCVLRLLIDRNLDGHVSLAWPAKQWATYRWTAMIIGVIVGASLGTSGTLLQALLRNPLAEPFILGLSSGAGLGVMVMLYIAYRLPSQMGGLHTDIRTIPAIIGALAVLAIVYGLGQRRGWLDPVSLVLVGVIISTMCGAGIMFVQHLVPTGLRGEFTTWLMGYIPETADQWEVITISAILIAGLVFSMILGGAMDAATLGDDEARSVGVSVGFLRLVLFVVAGALGAVSVALAGPIGFVGLVGPHAARLIVGPRHRSLIPAAAMMGIVLIVGADVFRQAIDLGAGRMPIGVFTAIIGGPVFIWLLLTERGQS